MSYDPRRLVGVIDARQIFLRRIFKPGKVFRACGRRCEKKMVDSGGKPWLIRLPFAAK